MATFFTSGEWLVKPGQEEEFFAAWLAAKEPDPPLRVVVTPPRLLRDLHTPGRFVSFAEFDSLEAIDEAIGPRRDRGGARKRTGRDCRHARCDQRRP